MSNFSGRVSTSSTFRVPTTRPKVFNATLPHLSVARGHSRRPSREQNMPSRSRDALADPPVSRMRLFAHETSLADSFVSRTRRSAHETTLADSPVSRTRRFAHKTDSESPSVSRTHRLAHETTSADPPVSRTRRFAHETTSEGHSVSRTRRLAHETTSEDPPVSRMRLFAHETTLEDTDKPFLYQSYLLATLVHQTSPSCTKNSHTVSLGLLFFLRICFELFV